MTKMKMRKDIVLKKNYFRVVDLNKVKADGKKTVKKDKLKIERRGKTELGP